MKTNKNLAKRFFITLRAFPLLMRAVLLEIKIKRFKEKGGDIAKLPPNLETRKNKCLALLGRVDILIKRADTLRGQPNEN